MWCTLFVLGGGSISTCLSFLCLGYHEQRLRLLFLLSIILWGSDTLHESNLELIGAIKVLGQPDTRFCDFYTSIVFSV